MGGVDLHDQILTYYSLSIKAMKWYKKFSFHMFDICVFNTSCLYHKQDANQSTIDLAFREKLVIEILSSTVSHPAFRLRKQAPVQRLEGENPPRLTERYFQNGFPALLQL